MAIGERIHFFRLLRGMTQNILVQLSAFLKGAPMCVWRNMNRLPQTKGGFNGCTGAGA